MFLSGNQWEKGPTHFLGSSHWAGHSPPTQAVNKPFVWDNCPFLWNSFYRSCLFLMLETALIFQLIQMYWPSNQHVKNFSGAIRAQPNFSLSKLILNTWKVRGCFSSGIRRWWLKLPLDCEQLIFRNCGEM